MGGVPVKHHTHGKVGRRRSHLALKKTSLIVCPTCGGPRRPHQTCAQCGAFQTHAEKNTGAPVVQKEKKASIKKIETATAMEEVKPAEETQQEMPEEEMPMEEGGEKTENVEMPKEPEMEKTEENQEKNDDSQS